VVVVAALAYSHGLTVISHECGWSRVVTLIAAWLPVIPIFMSPLYEAIFHGSWTAFLICYGLFIALGVPYVITEDRRKRFHDL
jgi:hypothetical protein